LASLFFYGFWNPAYLLVLLLSISFNYIAGLGLSQQYGYTSKNSALLAFSITANLLLLGYFKYTNFLISNMNGILPVNLPLQEITLPLAISFFTFQQIAYLVDAYRGEVDSYNFLEYTLFVVFFPQLIAGPVVHHKDVIPQFLKHEIYQFNAGNVVIGLTYFSFGLFKKVVIADQVKNYADPIFNAAAHAEPTTLLMAWCGALAYALQLYFDFSGYSDMAIGLARMFGIKLPINFNSPYKAASIRDFWRRWHITLSNFLRDYLYIPLGGNRQGQFRQVLNLITTMLLGGLWHGAGWTFIFWGGLHGTYLIIHRQWENLSSFILPTPNKKPWWSQILNCLITFMAVVVAWVFFRAPHMKAAILILESMCGLHGISLPSPLEKYLSFLSPLGIQFQGVGELGFRISEAFAWIFVLLLIVWLTPNTHQWLECYKPALNIQLSNISPLWKRLQWRPNNLWLIISTAITVVSVFHISQDNEFIYFQF
jgi:D-alanyl-lipoteichoic acid acyltransferase DltB (MBOAT superfamily)